MKPLLIYNICKTTACECQRLRSVRPFCSLMKTIKDVQIKNEDYLYKRLFSFFFLSFFLPSNLLTRWVCHIITFSLFYSYLTRDRVSLQDSEKEPRMYFMQQFTLEICALRPSFLHKFTLIWHHAFVTCAQLIAFFPRFRSTLCFTPCVQLFEIHKA
jgi:hypothetical protein